MSEFVPQGLALHGAQPLTLLSCGDHPQGMQDLDPCDSGLMPPSLPPEQAARLKKLQEQEKQQKVEFRKRVSPRDVAEGSLTPDSQ